MTVDSPSGFSWTIDTYSHALFHFLLVISFYPYLSSTLLYINFATGSEGHFLPRRCPFGSNRVSRSVSNSLSYNWTARGDMDRTYIIPGPRIQFYLIPNMNTGHLCGLVTSFWYLFF